MLMRRQVRARSKRILGTRYPNSNVKDFAEYGEVDIEAQDIPARCLMEFGSEASICMLSVDRSRAVKRGPQRLIWRRKPQSNAVPAYEIHDSR